MAITTNQRNAASTSAVDKAAYAPTSTETVRNILLAYIAENGGVDLTAPGPIGATTPGTGAFTTLTSTKLALGTTPADGVLTTNTTDASAGTPVQYSPAFALSGTGWATDSTSSMAVKFRQYVVPAQGTSAPTGKLTWDSSVGGAAAVTRMTLDTLGDLIVTSSKASTILAGVTGTHFVIGAYGSSSAANSATNRLTLAANTPLGWSNTINAVSVSANIDTSIIRSSGGVVEINNGTVGTLRDLSLRNLTASGTITATPNTLTGAGAISISTTTTGYISTGAAQALTLADGANGQIKTIIHTSDGGSGVLTPTTKPSTYTTITFTNVGDAVTLQFITGTGWCIIGIYGAVAV